MSLRKTVYRMHVIAGAQEQMDTISSLLKRRWTTAAREEGASSLASEARPGRHGAPERHRCSFWRPRSKFTRRQRRSRLRMPPRSGLMTRSAAGTASVTDVHQRQRTVDDASGLSQDLSSLDEDDNLVRQQTHVARCRVRSCSGSS